MVFQSYALFPHLTIAGNVGYGLRVKRLPRDVIRDRVGAMLERVGLADKAARYPRELSGGQMQRVALARALINEPSVLLLDEPLGALDAKLRRDMQMELRRMHRDLGITFVCVTHDQEEALVMSDRLGIMDGGELVQLGTPQEVFEKPRTSFVADFIGGCNFIPGRVGADGALHLDAGLRWEAGDHGAARPVTLALRHRKLRLGAGSGVDMLGLDTVVRDVAYVGSVRRLMLETAGGNELLAEFDADAIAGAELSPGSLLPVSIRREDLIVYDEPVSPDRGR
jgi:spermidine/putrescine transport system ATP-binding protein